MNIVELTAREIAEKVKSRELSAREVLDAHLDHIKIVDGQSGKVGGDPNFEPDKVHAFINVTAERAKVQADRVDMQIASGENPGCLAGVPVTIKDI
ncbi:MAG: Asp-tRNA(Asn)/Glu-tRNA(Gln) amidotransferase subunit GatA, partial [Chloroflexota bacterium]